jgi:hypothetical protein
MYLELINLSQVLKTTLRRDKVERHSQPLLARIGTLPWGRLDQLRGGSWQARLTSIAKILLKECQVLEVTPLKSEDARL